MRLFFNLNGFSYGSSFRMFYLAYVNKYSYWNWSCEIFISCIIKSLLKFIILFGWYAFICDTHLGLLAVFHDMRQAHTFASWIFFLKITSKIYKNNLCRWFIYTLDILPPEMENIKWCLSLLRGWCKIEKFIINVFREHIKSCLLVFKFL